jgi:hypothetical protein
MRMAEASREQILEAAMAEFSAYGISGGGLTVHRTPDATRI